jgi:F0F1-type ATP synthase membrane subunit b/b'
MLLLQLVVMQILIFGVVIYVLKKLLYGDTESAVNRLDKSYKELSVKKHEMGEKMFEMQKEYEKKKAEAEQIAADMKEKADKEIAEKRDEIIHKAKEEAERIVSDTQNMKQKIREDIRKEEENSMLLRCSEIMDSMFRNLGKGRINAVMVEDFLNEFENMDMSHIPPGVQEVVMVVSETLPEELIEKAYGAIARKAPKGTKIKETVDKKILGGMVLKFGGIVIDGSVASRLKEKIMERMV